MSVEDFNNAGVAAFWAGEREAAWDLFKGALEYKLWHEQNTVELQRAEEESPSPVCGASKAIQHEVFDSDEPIVEGGCRRSVQSNKYIARARKRLEKFQDADIDIRRPLSCSKASSPWLLFMERSSFGSSPVHLLSGYEPFLYLSPFVLNRSDGGSNRKSRWESAAIIFNLAIADHSRSFSSAQAISLYQLAIALLAGESADELGIALINNMGVWCAENGRFESAAYYMDNLALFVLQNSGGFLSFDANQGFRSNVIWLLRPASGASPAA